MKRLINYNYNLLVGKASQKESFHCNHQQSQRAVSIFGAALFLFPVGEGSRDAIIRI